MRIIIQPGMKLEIVFENNIKERLFDPIFISADENDFSVDLATGMVIIQPYIIEEIEEPISSD